MVLVHEEREDTGLDRAATEREELEETCGTCAGLIVRPEQIRTAKEARWFVGYCAQPNQMA